MATAAGPPAKVNRAKKAKYKVIYQKRYVVYTVYMVTWLDLVHINGSLAIGNITMLWPRPLQVLWLALIASTCTCIS